MEILRRQALMWTGAALVAPGTALAMNAEEPKEVERAGQMKVKDVFILFCTPKMIECRDFYVKMLGFEAAFQSTIYIQLHAPAEAGPGFSLAFMPPDHPFGDIYRDVYSGRGAFLTIEVADAKQVHDKIAAQGVKPIYPLKDEDWGQRHFSIKDPHGTIVDVVQTIEPAPGYYDKLQLK